ncbi:MAG: hypothetical protein CL908_18065 [Deltaproteobacteria bacterium]|nr:hypothetical protein [Deltaproteobacteria bacterium]
MTSIAGGSRTSLLPNLAAEEGEDWRAYPGTPQARAAAHLWALLFSRGSTLHHPLGSARGAWHERSRESLWPVALGEAPNEAVWPWLEGAAGARAWLNTESIAASARQIFASQLAGPTPECVRRVHDKAFATGAARELGLMPRALEPLIEVLDPSDLVDAEALGARLEAARLRWPAWTGGRFTLKPRFGCSGRGRVGGRGAVTVDPLRGALPRLAARGGAIFEPWLERSKDLSVSLHVPEPDDVAWPTIVGSLEMLVNASGAFRGHCGEVDNRGRVFSGDGDDETLRADAAAVAGRAREEGFSGPCGVDSFRYAEADRERLRGAVEFNARPTMGLVCIGLVRRALPQVREALDLTPGQRRGFLLTTLEPDADVEAAVTALVEAAGAGARCFDLTTPDDAGSAHPLLVFARELAPLRAAHRDQLGC